MTTFFYNFFFNYKSKWFILFKNLLLIILLFSLNAGSDSWELLMVKTHEGEIDIFMVLLGIIYSGVLNVIVNFSYESKKGLNIVVSHLVFSFLIFATGIMTTFIIVYLKAILGNTMVILIVATILMYISLIFYEFNKFSLIEEQLKPSND